MSCTVHSPTDSLTQPACILVYIECNPAPEGSPFELSLGLRSNSRVLSSPSSQSPLVWWFVLGSPWVTSHSLSPNDWSERINLDTFDNISFGMSKQPASSLLVFCITLAVPWCVPQILLSQQQQWSWLEIYHAAVGSLLHAGHRLGTAVRIATVRMPWVAMPGQINVGILPISGPEIINQHCFFELQFCIKDIFISD